MSFLAIVILAIGLAMDAVAVAAAQGLAAPRVEVRHAGLVALFFGGLQALMPLLGWAIGAQLDGFAQAWAHWVSFSVLAAIGAKMLWEALFHDGEADAKSEPLRARTLLALGIATSLDAFAVGVALPLMDAPIVTTLATIGIVTALLSVAALYLGRRLGAHAGKKLDVAGGLILLAVAGNILLEHFWS